MQLQKPGIRVLGIAESYTGRKQSQLCGVVMRRDLHIDGFTFGCITVGGYDATTRIISMIRDLNRKDINLVFLSGCIIAWYNIIYPDRILAETSLPVICLSYEESEGLTGHIRHHFPGDPARLAQYESLGERIPVPLPTGHILYARGWGITESECIRACRLFTHHGKIPEPVRVARLCARGLMTTLTREPDAEK